jgi:ABC-2 type transport system permease protein
MNMMQNKKNRIKTFGLIADHFIHEIKAIFTDRGALLILIGAMIIYPIVYSIGYYNETMKEIKTAVVDMDKSELSRKYMRMLDATKDIQVNYEPLSLKEAEMLFLNNEVEGVVLIPKNFQSDIMKSIPVKVAIYADASYFLKYRNVYLAASVVNSYFSGGIATTRYMIEGKSLTQAKIAANPLDVQSNILYNPSSGYASFIMPGLILIILQQTLLIGIGILGGSFSESKKSPFILPAGHRKAEILPYLTGKTGAYLLVSLINVTFGAIMIHHWFRYPDKASVLEILMLIFPFVMAVTVLGIGLSTLFKHRESSIVFMVFLSPIALFLSGLSWPVSSIPKWLVLFSKLMPSTTVVPAYLRLRTMGVGLAGIKHDVLFLYGQAALYTLFTVVYFYIRMNHTTRRSWNPNTDSNKITVETVI